MKDDKLWRIFSLYIRLRDSDKNGYGNCVTCNKHIHYQGNHCGHFISRKHLATKFDEQNCALQCVYCNTYNQGEQFKFGREIDKRYGEGTAEKILLKSRQVCKRGKAEIEVMEKYYKERVKELKSLKQK